MDDMTKPNQHRVQERLNLQMNDTISNDIAFISRRIYEIDMTRYIYDKRNLC